ncbi:CIC11C00000004648 [Sungouiella intermedia]|uniref:CIC11C00000004648 n=1 Tax=Sungouiella intermedia TaxID=45354 RepID=A0A1L0DDY3_9ASCO|nr:CIC11C00000004648 [[Candida] intermedia]
MPLVQRRRSSAQLEKEWVDFDALDTSLYKEEAPLSETVKSLKIKAVEEALNAGRTGLVTEYSRATEGLISTHLRAKVWPLLLDVDLSGKRETQSDGLFSTSDIYHFGTNDLPPHKDENQVMLDVKRLFTVLSHFNGLHTSLNSSFTTILSQDEIECLRKRLFCLVVRVLRKYPFLNYYQGYHDVASVVLLVFNDLGLGDDEQAFLVLEKITVNHLRDFMISDIALSINHLKLIPCIVEDVDPALFQVIRQSSNSYLASNGMYFDYKFLQALLSVLTLFSHDISNTSHLLVMWDFIFSYNSVAVSLYIYVAAMLHFKEPILKKLNISDSPSFFNVDPDLAHTLLSPSNLFDGLTDHDVVKILTSTKQLIESYPITESAHCDETFDVWFGEFNQHSVLCTTSRLEMYDAEINKAALKTHIFSEAQEDLSSSSETATATSPEIPPIEVSPVVTCISDSKELESIFVLQVEEQRNETIHETKLFQHALEQDSLATSISSLDGGDGSSRVGLLSSSISNITAASSAINHKLMRSSSVFFKNLFSRGDSEEPEGSVSKKNGQSILQSRVYKVSVTVGFVGFMIHFLLKNSDGHHSGIYRMVHGDFSSLKHLLSVFDIGLLKREMFNFGSELVSGASHIAGDMVTYVRDSEVMSAGVDFTQVGLGSLRNSVYAFGN